MRHGAAFTTALPVVAAALLAACSGAPEQPGGITADEARQLNEAAAMLDANSVDANALAPAEGRATP